MKLTKKHGKVVAITTMAATVLAGGIITSHAFNSEDYDNSFTFAESSIAVSNEDGSGYKIEGTDLTINAAGTYAISGNCSEGSITVKKGTTGVVLVFDELTLKSSTTAPVSVNKGAEAKIIINGTNTLTDSENPDNENSTDEEIADAFEGAGIKVKSGSVLTIGGTGKLTVDGSSCKNGIKGAQSSVITVGEDSSDTFTLNVNANNNALAADGELIINSGNVNITSNDDGLKASPDEDDTESKGILTVNGGTINITAADDAIHATNETNLLGGNITISAGDDAAKAEYTLNIGHKDGNGPDITVTKAVEGFEGAIINLYSGNGTLRTSDDGMNAANSDLNNYSFELNVYGGKWYVNADGDGLDSNGNMTIDGGYTEVFGSADNGNGALDIGDFGCSLNYNAGTIVAVGMNGMAVTPTSGSYLAFGNGGQQGGMNGGMPGQQGQQGQMPGGPQDNANATISSGATIEIKDSSDNTIYTATAPKNANHVVYADDTLSSDETYTLYVNGTSIGTATLSSGSSSNQPGFSPDENMPVPSGMPEFNPDESMPVPTEEPEVIPEIQPEETETPYVEDTEDTEEAVIDDTEDTEEAVIDDTEDTSDDSASEDSQTDISDKKKDCKKDFKKNDIKDKKPDCNKENKNIQDNKDAKENADKSENTKKNNNSFTSFKNSLVNFFKSLKFFR
ncbi:MAG: carbohydrate-binding domain-containing protein [Lachnospiraceae bacterium]|nr:carbohydrate-binding domain-containing protein [Lachnospiraceae bacterium]